MVGLGVIEPPLAHGEKHGVLGLHMHGNHGLQGPLVRLWIKKKNMNMV
jgi:hypothetical protein